MDSPPINVFSARRDPAAVLNVLRELATSVETVERAEGDWRTLRVTFDGGAWMSVRHDPSYYAGPDWSRQVEGMIGYLLRFPHAPAKHGLMRSVRTLTFSVSFMGDELDAEDSDDPRVNAVYAVCAELDGFVFIPSAFFDAQGLLLLDAEGAFDESAAPPAVFSQGPREEHDDNAPPLPPRRTATFATLDARGFRPARWLPVHRTEGRPEEDVLRPVEEIARRLMALDALFTWVSQASVDPERVRAYAMRNHLQAAMPDEERALFEAPRADAAREQSSIGWRLENMWPLAWALGFDRAPDVGGAMIDGDVIGALGQFLPRFDDSTEDFLARARVRPAGEVCDLEDLFYCAHNAVRSAQLGCDTVPSDFDPTVHGGVVHERRHALTWMISPGVDWDEADLST